MLTQHLKELFFDLAVQLSPENISCDGELSSSAVNRRRRSIMKKWGELEREAGEIVTETRAWSFGSFN